MTPYLQNAENRIDKSSTKEEALETASHAAELYMKATKLASNESERRRLRAKCIELLSRAEEIKNAQTWTPQKVKAITLRVPKSERAISKREEIILLEGSRLHGFLFPPWTTDPDDSVFDAMINGDEYFT